MTGIDSPEQGNALDAFSTLGDFLKDDGWYPQQLDGKQIYRMGFGGHNGQMTCYAQVWDDLEQFAFYVLAPVKAPEALRPAAAEFITRANYGLRIGNFELDYLDGELRYKSSLDFEGVALTLELINNAIYPAVQTMDRYIPGLMEVIYGDRSPAEAVAAIENETG